MTRLVWALGALLVLGCGSGGTADGAGGTGAMGGSSGIGGTSGAGGAGGSAGSTGGAAGSSSTYADDSKWICRPDIADNPCLETIDYTEIAADGMTTVAQLGAPSGTPAIDCFYLYATVDLGDVGVRNLDFPDIVRENLIDQVHQHAAWFRDVCRIYAPVYRQMSFASYGAGADAASAGLDIAHADAAEAFQYYLDNFNEGRDVVVLGHSQGAHTLTRLLARDVEGNDAIRSRLLAALLIGSLGDFYVPDGEVVGGTLSEIPLCGTREERGCVITFNTFFEGFEPSPLYGSFDGDAGCTSPIPGGSGTSAAAVLPTFRRNQSGSTYPPLDYGATVDTEFVMLRSLYSAECARSDREQSYLKITHTPGMNDVRPVGIPLADAFYDPTIAGLHYLDFGIVLEDVLDLVRAKAAGL